MMKCKAWSMLRKGSLHEASQLWIWGQPKVYKENGLLGKGRVEVPINRGRHEKC